MGGTSKDDLEALWKRNVELRKKALSNKLSPQEFQSLPPQLRSPHKLYGPRRPQGLRGPALVEWAMFLGEICQDKRFYDFINALLEHGIVEPALLEDRTVNPRTHEFTNWQGPEIDRDNEYQQERRLEEVRALIEQGMDVRPACRKVAAEWALGTSLTAGEQLKRPIAPPEAADQH